MSFSSLRGVGTGQRTSFCPPVSKSTRTRRPVFVFTQWRRSSSPEEVVRNPNVPDGSPKEEPDQRTVQVAFVLQRLRRSRTVFFNQLVPEQQELNEITSRGSAVVFVIVTDSTTALLSLGISPETIKFCLSAVLPAPAEAGSPAALGQKWSPSTGPLSSSTPGLGSCGTQEDATITF